MRTTSDTLVVTFDSSVGDKSGMVVSRVVKRKVEFVKVEAGEQADILYRLLTDQTAKAEIKAEGSEKRNCNNCKYGYQSSVCQKPTAEICGNDFSQWMPCDAKGGEKE